MKLKNLAFFGVMASILSVASAQAADPVNPGYIASKGYVDSKFDSVSGDLGQNYYTKGEMDTALAGKQGTISDLADIRSGAAAGATALQENDNVSALTNDAGYITKDVNDLTNYTTTTAMNTALGAKANSADLATVATSGKSSDLNNDAGFITSADLPVVDQEYNAESTNAQSGKAVASAISGVSSDMTSHINDTVKHITAAERTAWNGKQDALTDAQMNAVNSGITADKVSTYDGYAAGKQDTISDLATIRSGAEAGATALQATSALDGSKLTAGSVEKTALATAVQDAIDNALVKNGAITASTANSIVQYDEKGLVKSGTAAGELATATLTACPENADCVVTKDASGHYAYTPIQK